MIRQHPCRSGVHCNDHRETMCQTRNRFFEPLGISIFHLSDGPSKECHMLAHLILPVLPRKLTKEKLEFKSSQVAHVNSELRNAFAFARLKLYSQSLSSSVANMVVSHAKQSNTNCLGSSETSSFSRLSARHRFNDRSACLHRNINQIRQKIAARCSECC